MSPTLPKIIYLPEIAPSSLSKRLYNVYPIDCLLRSIWTDQLAIIFTTALALLSAQYVVDFVRRVCDRICLCPPHSPRRIMSEGLVVPHTSTVQIYSRTY